MKTKTPPFFFILFFFICIPVFSNAQIEDFSFQNGENYQLAEFRFWNPNLNDNYNGVLVLTPGINQDGREAVLDSVWQKFAVKHNFIIVGCYFKNYESTDKSRYIDASKGSGDILLKSIKKYSKAIFNNDINELPLLLFGMSAGGQFNYEFVAWKPEKVISFVVNKGGYYSTGITSDESQKVPGIFFIGEDDLYYRNNMILGIYSANRSQGANWTLITEKDTKHSLKNSKALSITFFESVMLKRLRNNVLLDISSDNPLLVFKDRKTFKYLNEIEDANFNQWGKLNLLTIWLPDERFGDIWLESL
jgi:dienelactone hydrolase